MLMPRPALQGGHSRKRDGRRPDRGGTLVQLPRRFNVAGRLLQTRPRMPRWHRLRLSCMQITVSNGKLNHSPLRLGARLRQPPRVGLTKVPALPSFCCTDAGLRQYGLQPRWSQFASFRCTGRYEHAHLDVGAAAEELLRPL